MTWRDPQAARRASAAPGGAAPGGAARVPVVVLFLAVIGGIYAGVFTATEGAASARGALAFALARRALTWRVFVEVLIESVRTTSMLFMILIGALIFANFINYTTMPSDLKGFVTQFAVHPILVIVRSARSMWCSARRWRSCR